MNGSLPEMTHRGKHTSSGDEGIGELNIRCVEVIIGIIIDWIRYSHQIVPVLIGGYIKEEGRDLSIVISVEDLIGEGSN
jgi:hypothetical protein